ncbi:thiol-disulfide isomerase/thioredoxin [Lewinella aquimaris]|uniref:Thiol-disulfide isomerase/thioredoxin n=1 Tax=Neolewinella aquimaris TaxID=1835722 RepID=A0A840E2N1_9BACT|nr:thioredoxin family protein [Neolewinella aquimaris]MBB4079844.1 thiol-disulfide isomerase/thioredoxin [Neolewinella aquimaris]
MHLLKVIFTGLLTCLILLPGSAQSGVRWLSFSQLADSLKVSPRPVFVDFYADWCTACVRMDRRAFRHPEVVRLLNDRYYAVRMDVESPDTIVFGGQVFVNERLGRVNPIHQIPLLMAGRRGKPFSLPAMVLLDEQFSATARYFQYLSAEQLIEILSD